MSLELTVTPRGHLLLRRGDSEEGDRPSPWADRVVAGFCSCPGAGLFAMAATNPLVPPHPSLVFWREYARAGGPPQQVELAHD